MSGFPQSFQTDTRDLIVVQIQPLVDITTSRGEGEYRYEKYTPNIGSDTSRKKVTWKI
jgi:hypothetical protein